MATIETYENIKFSRIFYPKGNLIEVEAGTWTIGQFSTGKKKWNGGKVSQETISFLANQEVNVGINTKARYDIQGYWGRDNRGGSQFVITRMKMIMDTKSAKGLEQAFELIMTQLMAKRVLEHFESDPDKAIEAFENRYSTELLTIKGMTQKKLDEYYEKFDEKINGQEAIVELLRHGFTAKQAAAIYRRYGDMEIINELLDNAGMYDFYLDGAIKLFEAEQVARARNVEDKHVKRIAAYFVHYYKRPFQNHSYLKNDEITNFVIPFIISEIGAINQADFNSALNYLYYKDVIYRSEHGRIGLKVIRDTEFGIYQTMHELKKAVSTPMNVIERVIDSAEIQLSDEQREAVVTACTNSVSIISGNAGAGKSTILGIITKIFTELGYDIMQVALSGKAALRIAETTGMPAQTIHRMFGTVCSDMMPDIDNPYLKLGDAELTSDVLILDEASMVGGAIFYNLLKLANQSEQVKHIIIVGDDAQLPPIGTGQAFSDLLNYSSLPKAKLTKVYRQASESGTLAAATYIRQNQNFIPSLNDFGSDFQYHQTLKAPEVFAEYQRMLADNDGNLMEVQIIAMTNDEVTTYNVWFQKMLGIVSNRKFESKLNGKPFTIYEGSKVMVNQNQYKTLTAEGKEGGHAVFNGNLGIVKSIKDEYMVINFPGIGEVGILKKEWINLRLGYAITIHKSQGSGFNSIIARINDGIPQMLTSNMMYTAITRAKNECMLISPAPVVNLCSNTNAAERQTWLPTFYGGKQ